MSTSILIIAWNSQHFHLAVHELQNEYPNFKITIKDVQSLNRTNQLPADISSYDAIIVNQMGTGEWEKEVIKLSKSKIFIAFQSSIDEHSNISKEDYGTLNLYLAYDGVENLKNFVKFIMRYFDANVEVEKPRQMPWNGIYHPKGGLFEDVRKYLEWYRRHVNYHDLVGLLFYRGRYLFRNTAHIDMLISELEKQGIGVIPVFTLTFPDERVGNPGVEEAIKKFFFVDGKPLISLLLWGLYFRVSGDIELLKRLDAPILNIIEIYSSSPEEWRNDPQGLNATATSMAVALPEFSGVINPIVFSAEVKTPVILKSVPIDERIRRIVEQTKKWLKLRSMRNCEKRVAIVLHTSDIGNLEANIGTACGLDTFESIIEILRAMKERGYEVKNIPRDGKELARIFLEQKQMWEGALGHGMNYAFIIDSNEYSRWFGELPSRNKRDMLKTWGEFEDVEIPGLSFGEVFVTIQPPRVKTFNPEDFHKLMHDPTLPIPHYYYAFYKFINENFDAVIHVGKHGSLEWLPGKSVGLSNECYSDICLHSIPNIYIYIVNNPAEGTQAKRRGYATIIDHLPPPMKSSNRYEELEVALDEYFKAKGRGLEEHYNVAKKRIIELARSFNFEVNEENFDDSALRLHSKILEQNESLYNYGLHVFGRINRPTMDELINAIVKPERIILKKIGIEYDEALKNPSKSFNGYTLGEIIRMIKKGEYPEFLRNIAEIVEGEIVGFREEVRSRLENIVEIENLLKALEGKFIEPAPSGDITRGRIEAIPTGFNFYSVDPYAIPSKTSWEVGKKLADQLIQKLIEKEGSLPESVAFIEWSSDPMNTDGEQIAEILYLLGVEPAWEGNRVMGLRIIPLEELKRPRVDVTVRISGLFRDTFMNLVELIDEATVKVATLDEPLEMNYVRKHFLDGLRYRVFGDKPGSYGAGVNHAINSSHWQDERELAEIYTNWGCYAYGKGVFGIKAKEEFKLSLKNVGAIIRNHYTDEWDILDDDCPYAFQGGLALTVEKLTGRMPEVLIVDTRNPESTKVVNGREEIERVVRKTLFNPDWIEGMKKHGYKGAGDIMKRIVNLFGWQATAKVVDDWIFNEVAERYVLNDEMRRWFMDNNPYAIEEIARRLMEAYKRRLWNASESMIEKIENVYAEIEGYLEEGI
ncbi:hypothetical protein DRN63_00060 [Nanoarchaeota archaeon]|nr:MAG: hypothetical protein DRN63_00060 [Nanoarchaeota archaeon]